LGGGIKGRQSSLRKGKGTQPKGWTQGNQTQW
jgi:hypothetical protein